MSHGSQVIPGPELAELVPLDPGVVVPALSGVVVALADVPVSPVPVDIMVVSVPVPGVAA